MLSTYLCLTFNLYVSIWHPCLTQSAPLGGLTPRDWHGMYIYQVIKERKSVGFARNPVGPDRGRTGDLLLAKQALSQLSYGPGYPGKWVGPGGFEPPTPRLSSVCSNQLSYEPGRLLRVCKPMGIPLGSLALHLRETVP